ncbi:MAG: type I-U CRISPR-associated RAMP protein Csb1/Cas7u [Phycisphaeraceae bacterium]
MTDTLPDTTSDLSNLLLDDGPAAITLKQALKPAGDEVVFPPTYANPNGEKGKPVYNIDRFDHGGKNGSICVIDSIPSQGNRIEPAFATIAGGKLVPQIVVTVEKTGEQVNLLDAGHRAADAIVRFSTLGPELADAFKARLKGDSLPLAKIAPTSLVFGVWDSRDSGAKVPRLVNSIIRAYDVDALRRSAQYVPAIADYAEAGVDKDTVTKLSEHGMAAVPATYGLGGVIARSGIYREASLNLAALRDITTTDPEMADKLRRYVLGLALVAITYFDGRTLNLRQGCQLVGVPDEPMTRKLVNADGTEQELELTRDAAIACAQAAAEAFGVREDRLDERFDLKLAKAAAKK